VRARAVRGKLWVISADLLLRKPKPRGRPWGRMFWGGVIHTTRTATARRDGSKEEGPEAAELKLLVLRNEGKRLASRYRRTGNN